MHQNLNDFHYIVTTKAELQCRTETLLLIKCDGYCTYSNKHLFIQIKGGAELTV